MNLKKEYKTGCLISGILILLLVIGILIVGVRAYEGHCLAFEPPERPCSLLQFLYPYLVLLVVYSIIGRPILAILVFLIILAPALIGFLLSRRSRLEIID